MAVYQHQPIPDLIRLGVLSQDELHKYFKFCVVRNPVDRCLSGYAFYQKHYREFFPSPQPLSTFAEYVDFIYQQRNNLKGVWVNHLLPQHFFAEGVDYVGRFEQLPLVNKKLNDYFGISRQLERCNQGERRTASISADEKAKIREVYLEDFKQFYKEEL